MINAVFDTNILFSATGWRGSPYQCLKFIREKKATLILCSEILAEYEEKLQTRLDMTEQQVSRMVAEVLACATVVEIKNELHVVLNDPDDDMVVECAIEGKAAYIVSGDRHLLELKEYEGIVVVRTNEFLDLAAEDNKE
jgi:putative PIN family toxin of toxin-antitoxin system